MVSDEINLTEDFVRSTAIRLTRSRMRLLVLRSLLFLLVFQGRLVAFLGWLSNPRTDKIHSLE
jgi:hypothetical protein